jgi:hypothetical protein
LPPRTKAAAQGKPIKVWATRAIAAMLKSTRPMASSKIGLRWRRRSCGEEKKAAELRSGGRKTRKITSGEISTVGSPGTKPMRRPPRTRKTG